MTVQPVLCVFPYVQGQELWWKNGGGAEKKAIPKKVGGSSSKTKKYESVRAGKNSKGMWKCRQNETNMGDCRE